MNWEIRQQAGRRGAVDGSEVIDAVEILGLVLRLCSCRKTFLHPPECVCV